MGNELKFDADTVDRISAAGPGGSGRARLIRAALTVLTIVGLSGCAPAHDQAPRMQYAEAEAELADLLTAIAATVPGEWKITDAGARSCALQGSTGAQVTKLRLGPGVTDGQQEATAAVIEKLLIDAGFPPVRRDRTPTGAPVVIELNYPGEGADDTGFYVSVQIGTAGTTALGQSRCGEGDANQINEDRRASEEG